MHTLGVCFAKIPGIMIVIIWSLYFRAQALKTLHWMGKHGLGRIVACGAADPEEVFFGVGTTVYSQEWGWENSGSVLPSSCPGGPARQPVLASGSLLIRCSQSPVDLVEPISTSPVRATRREARRQRLTLIGVTGASWISPPISLTSWTMGWKIRNHLIAMAHPPIDLESPLAVSSGIHKCLLDWHLVGRSTRLENLLQRVSVHAVVTVESRHRGGFTHSCC